MTNVRTVVPGVEDNNQKTTIYNQVAGGNQPGQSGNNRQTRSADYAKGTKVFDEDNTASNQKRQESSEAGGKPIIGFLASVSRTNEGEYWVIRLGQNIIGSGKNCHVVLNEASVSEKNVILFAQRNPKTNKLNVTIKDDGSLNGILVNDDLVGYDSTHACKNFDKISIGKYELLLLLFDVNEHALKKESAFIPKYSNGNNDFSYPDRDLYPDDSGKTRI
jgi:pSer/pThr/pTyr-binding forkhead associated (FHA) protein